MATQTHATTAFDLNRDHALAALGSPIVEACHPTPVESPRLAAFNPDVAALLDMDGQAARQPDGVAVLAGNRIPVGAQPVAHRYAGHQFGVWAGQLGDGRAITLGGVRNRRGSVWEIQLKGCGQTPFSRFADGRAVLRSTIREYLVSEAMAGLGIATTRALAMTVSDMPVYRETVETAAILTRVSPSLIRFGSFELLYYANRLDDLARLADHVIDAHFPQAAALTGHDRYRAWAEAVSRLTVAMIADWQAVGFYHGVMNTDNMSVLGLTMDYGPFAFMEGFQPHWCPNHTDAGGRYAWDRQPQAALWNMGRFLQAVLPLLADEPEAAVEFAEQLLADFQADYDAAWLQRMGAKLGLRRAHDEDRSLINDLLKGMAAEQADFTRAFRGLCHVGADDDLDAAAFVDEFVDRDRAARWLMQWRRRVRREQGASADHRRQTNMRMVNPKYVLRTAMAQHAIEQAKTGNYAEIERLQLLLRQPFEDQPGNDAYAFPVLSNDDSLVLSCSS